MGNVGQYPMSEDFVIRREDPGQPDVVALLANGEAFSASLYPAESNHHLSFAELQADNVRFLVARDGEGRALATGAVVLDGDWAEIKRMWAEPQGRSLGLGRRILAELTALAKAAGASALRLETGVANYEALALYERAGFLRRAPFADYGPDPLSVFMEKEL
jgi:putative acetyltransferase